MEPLSYYDKFYLDLINLFQTLFQIKRVENQIKRQWQIDPYRGKNTVKYGIENGETVGVELVYDFETSPTDIRILCKPNIKILSDSVMYVLSF